MDPEIIKQVEAVLFASGRFMDASNIATLMEANQKHVVRALGALQENYATSGSALRIVEEDGAWKIHVRDEYLDLVSRVVSDTEISGPVLETLAIVAWRTPILQAEVVDIRGSNAYEHIKELVERGFVTKEPHGRTYRLRITEKFFDYFDIEGRDDIRKVFKEVEEEHRRKEMELELEQKRLEEALRKAEGGEVAIVDEKDDVPTRRVRLDDLDEVLEKAAKKREEMNKNLQEAKEKEEKEDVSEDAQEEEDDEDREPFSPSGPVEKEKEDTDTLEETRQKAKKIREKVEEEVEEIDS